VNLADWGGVLDAFQGTPSLRVSVSLLRDQTNG
jgi:hypothetical protein